jgi:hypothetical protein
MGSISGFIGGDGDRPEAPRSGGGLGRGEKVDPLSRINEMKPEIGIGI